LGCQANKQVRGPGCTGGALFVAVVPAADADAALRALWAHLAGRDARVGESRVEPAGVVVLRTPIGGTRIVDARQ
jgi:hydrogenase expression/formation protein HypE